MTPDFSIRSRVQFFAAALVLGIGIGALWNYRLVDPLTTKFQILLLGTGDITNPVTAFAASFLVGLSVVICSCGWPLIFSAPVLIEDTRSVRGWLSEMMMYALGMVAVLALFGAFAGYFGGLILQHLATAEERRVVAVILYTFVGVFALWAAARELRFLPGGGLFSPERARGFSRRPFLLGVIFGGGIGVGSPLLAFQTVVAYVASTGNPLVGALVLGANGLGRVLVLCALGLLIFLGVGPARFFSYVERHAHVVRLASGLAFAFMGSFLLSFWTVVDGLRVLSGS